MYTVPVLFYRTFDTPSVQVKGGDSFLTLYLYLSINFNETVQVCAVFSADFKYVITFPVSYFVPEITEVHLPLFQDTIGKKVFN